MSVTWNSSKQSSQLSSAISAAASRIASSPSNLAVLQFLPEHPHPIVHVGHEFMEMGAALANHRTRFEEQVHHHGLAAADVAVDVEALDRLVLLAAAEQPAQRLASGAPSDARQRAARAPQSAPAARSWARIALELPDGDQVFVEFEDGHHGIVDAARGLSRPPIGPATRPASKLGSGRCRMPAMQIRMNSVV